MGLADGIAWENEHGATSQIKDSGARKVFASGAQRDISEGKGRCDLMPLDVVSSLMPKYGLVLNYIEEFKETKHVGALFEGLGCFSNLVEWDVYTMLLELSIHYEQGALKYSENNWKKGLPLHSFIDSGVRHYLKWCRGDKDEPHDRAFVWNIIGAIWTVENHPELDDINQDLVEPEATISLGTIRPSQEKPAL